MIWRSMFVEAEVDIAALAFGLAGALNADVARVAVVADMPDGWPEWVEGYEVVAETRPARGEARMLVTLFLFRDPAAVERVNDGAVMQALADRLGCAVLLPDEADTDPFNYLRFRPGSAADRVSLDPDALDEDPPRVVVFGPAHGKGGSRLTVR